MAGSTQCSSSRGKTRLEKRGEEGEMLNILEKKTLKQMEKLVYYAHKMVLIVTSSDGALSCIAGIFIIGAASSELDTYRICEQRRFRRGTPRYLMLSTFSRSVPSKVYEAWIFLIRFLVSCIILHLTG